ncbi:hypothetical protein [Micrococcus luteus]|uniref:hypothetical protein n=1 Tax=Micrococcus luteus TaxID=1270 RepID=UPI0021BD2923|nr:hypothetical protein [Micrococcus luteus]
MGTASAGRQRHCGVGGDGRVDVGGDGDRVPAGGGPRRLLHGDAVLVRHGVAVQAQVTGQDRRDGALQALAAVHDRDRCA